MSNVNVNLTLENIRTITVMFLDIFIMWLILYYTIRIVRSNSKTVQIFKGLLLIVIIDGLAKVLGMKTVAYFTDIFVNWGFLAMIIIFQPELRALLERLGKTNVFSRITTLTGNEKEHLVDQIVTATMLLSKDQTGALISIEQSHSLDDFIATGTRLNSDVTAELLTSIFVTSTPLHDGAVIIQGDKIACASAYFPPTNLDLPSRFGARHRAAIGISEITDAVTIVVSEETGAISVTENGQIISVNQKQLRNYLLRVICGEETEVRTSGRKVNEPAPREVIIDDTQQIEEKKPKKDHGMTSVLSVLAIKKQDAKEHQKIEVEEVIPAVSQEDEKMKELEEGISEIKLPHKKDRPAPSYPKNASTERFEAEKQREEELKKLQEAEEQRRLELAKQEEEERLKAQEEAERKAEEERLEQERLEKEEQERLAQEEQLRKEKEEQERKLAEERNQRAAQRMRERYEAEYKARAEKEAELKKEEAPAEPEEETPQDDHAFDTTKIDLSQMMGLDNELDKTFDLIDQIDVGGHQSSSDDEQEGGDK